MLSVGADLVVRGGGLLAIVGHPILGPSWSAGGGFDNRRIWERHIGPRSCALGNRTGSLWDIRHALRLSALLHACRAPKFDPATLGGHGRGRD